MQVYGGLTSELSIQITPQSSESGHGLSLSVIQDLGFSVPLPKNECS